MEKFKFNSKQDSSIVFKAIEQNIINFNKAEIDRVYKNCVAPGLCKKRLYKLICNGLSIEHLKNNWFEFNF